MKKLRLKSDNKIKRPLQKNRPSSGETLVEVLVSLLIISISIALLTTTVGSSGGLVDKSTKKMESYYEQSNAIAEQDSTDEDNTMASGKVTLKFVEAADVNDTSESSRVSANSDVRIKTKAANVNVTYFLNGSTAKLPVASYKGIFTTNHGGSGGTDSGNDDQPEGEEGADTPNSEEGDD